MEGLSHYDVKNVIYERFAQYTDRIDKINTEEELGADERVCYYKRAAEDLFWDKDIKEIIFEARESLCDAELENILDELRTQCNFLLL